MIYHFIVSRISGDYNLVFPDQVVINTDNNSLDDGIE